MEYLMKHFHASLRQHYLLIKSCMVKHEIFKLMRFDGIFEVSTLRVTPQTQRG